MVYNLLSLVKRSIELPKLECRVPEQKRKQSSPAYRREKQTTSDSIKENDQIIVVKKEKESSPVNININININNSVSPLNMRPYRAEVRVEINQNYFKKPFEYIQPYDYPGESSTFNYNSFIYNKDYLNYIDKVSKIFHKNSKPIPQIEQIILPNYTVK
jgi:hypothetical protein